MLIPKGTKIIVEGVSIGNTTVLSKDTTYLKLAETVEDIYKDRKVIGYKRFDNTVQLYTTDKDDSNNETMVHKGDTISFVSNNSLQYFFPQSSTTFSSVKESILLLYRNVKEETFRVNGKLLSNEPISGYLFIEDLPTWSKFNKSFYKIKNIKEVMKLGITKGDTLHIKGLSSFKIGKVEFNNGLLVLTVSY